jgi:hypothetical protein
LLGGIKTPGNPLNKIGNEKLSALKIHIFHHNILGSSRQIRSNSEDTRETRGKTTKHRY